MSKLNQIIQSGESIPFNESKIRRICGNKINVVSYHQLSSVKNIFELFKNNYPCIILYEITPNNGHWTCLLWHPSARLIEMYDSYGFGLDYDLRFNHFNRTPYLSQLVDNAISSGFRFSANDQDMQEKRGDVATCGRWAALRGLFSTYTNQQFNQMFSDQILLSKPDQIVTLMTLFSDVA